MPIVRKTVIVPWVEARYVQFTDWWHAHMDHLSDKLTPEGAERAPHHAHISRDTPHMTTVTLDEDGTAEVHLLYNEADPKEAALADKFRQIFGVAK